MRVLCFSFALSVLLSPTLGFSNDWNPFPVRCDLMETSTVPNHIIGLEISVQGMTGDQATLHIRERNTNSQLKEKDTRTRIRIRNENTFSFDGMNVGTSLIVHLDHPTSTGWIGTYGVDRSLFDPRSNILTDVNCLLDPKPIVGSIESTAEGK